MLKNIVEIVLLSNYQISSGTIFCNDITVADEKIFDCIKFLENQNVLENTDYDNKIGKKVNLELSLVRLNAIGFYEGREAFILRNRYEEPNELYYILELDIYSSASAAFIAQYRTIIDLIKSIEHFSKHTYTDTDLRTAIVFQEDQSLLLPLQYDLSTCNSVEASLQETFNKTIKIFREINSEKKLLFLNEFIASLKPVSENLRFSYFVKHLSSYYEKSINSYQYYLRDFSYNKLKVELDSKALEFAQKIQTVINDSQTKLIAIPTAFVLVVATFDFQNVLSSKNIGAIISLFIFSILIQLFLNNQRSTLKFIKENIEAYKATFKENVIMQTSNHFKLVEAEFLKQDSRLKIVEIILWAIPVGMLCLSIYLLYGIASVAFIYLAIIITHALLRANWNDK